MTAERIVTVKRIITAKTNEISLGYGVGEKIAG